MSIGQNHKDPDHGHSDHLGVTNKSEQRGNNISATERAKAKKAAVSEGDPLSNWNGESKLGKCALPDAPAIPSPAFDPTKMADFAKHRDRLSRSVEDSITAMDSFFSQYKEDFEKWKTFYESVRKIMRRYDHSLAQARSLRAELEAIVPTPPGYHPNSELLNHTQEEGRPQEDEVQKRPYFNPEEVHSIWKEYYGCLLKSDDVEREIEIEQLIQNIVADLNRLAAKHTPEWVKAAIPDVNDILDAVFYTAEHPEVQECVQNSGGATKGHADKTVDDKPRRRAQSSKQVNHHD